MFCNTSVNLGPEQLQYLTQMKRYRAFKWKIKTNRGNLPIFICTNISEQLSFEYPQSLLMTVGSNVTPLGLSRAPFKGDKSCIGLRNRHNKRSLVCVSHSSTSRRGHFGPKFKSNNRVCKPTLVLHDFIIWTINSKLVSSIDFKHWARIYIAIFLHSAKELFIAIFSYIYSDFVIVRPRFDSVFLLFNASNIWIHLKVKVFAQNCYPKMYWVFLFIAVISETIYRP